MNPADLTDDERYCYEERLGMLCGPLPPTTEQEQIAWQAVEQFRNNPMPAK